jgi:hypothetical protein
MIVHPYIHLLTIAQLNTYDTFHLAYNAFTLEDVTEIFISYTIGRPDRTFGHVII